MTIQRRIFSCLVAFVLSLVLLAALSFWNMSNSKATLDTILQDRLAPMRDLKVVADKYAVDIVDASHKARNAQLQLCQVG